MECRDGVAEEITCPDGLLVNEKAAAFRYPCDYPVDVDCGKRTAPRKFIKNDSFTPGVVHALKCYATILNQLFKWLCCASDFITAAAASSGNCARKWGMFKTGSDNSCGDFVNCVDGVEHNFKCPEGLAWHPTLWRCEWPDQVPTCNVEGTD